MFVDVLNRLIKEKGISRSQAFKDLGIGKNSSYYWRGGNLPNSATLNAIAEYFGVTTDYLLEKSTEKKPSTVNSAEPVKVTDSIDDILTRFATGLFAGLPTNDKKLAIEFLERLSKTVDRR